MSTAGSIPSADTKDAKEGHRKSLGKYVKRMSSVFKREKSSKSKPAASPTTAGPSTAAPAIEEEKEAAPAPPAIEPASTTVDHAAAPAAPAEAPKSPVPEVHELQRSVLQQERARALFAKYGLTLESHEWIAAPALPVNVQRIEKPIRMRVHRTCHRCGTTYGADKVCAKCEHKRCKKCPRYPKKKSPTEKAQVQAKEAAAAKALPKKKRVLTVPSRNGTELAYQPAKQRVRRNCHKCQALFIPPTATICESCRHIRCTKCPREPAKLNKWPNGYPGDAEYDSETELERELERSRRIYGGSQGRAIKRVRVQRSFDPEVVKSVEAKLKTLQMQDEAHGSSLGVEAT
ncbi:hypothetical protein N0V90_006924 [Kalmusia sp. IMI 367209]|nr:hypothetical protein N0V90_006924 [Kalmusia sp. IMI 367209]